MASRSPPPPRSPFARALLVIAPCGLAFAFAQAGWQACAIYDPSLLLPADASADAWNDDASAEASPDAQGDAPSCGHARWPDRPAADDPSPVSDIRVINALHTIDIGTRVDGGAPPAYGFDLDGVCTCPGPEACTAPKGAPAHCDDSEGRDNTGGALLRTLASFNVFDQTTINDRLQQGYYGFMIEVRGYNGKANDTKVTVAVYVSNGLHGIEDGGTPRPRNDGTDRWTIDPGSLLGGKNSIGVSCDGSNVVACTPLYFDDNAYVADHVLVGSLDFPLTLGSGAGFGMVVMDLTGSIVTAALTPVQTAAGPSYRLDHGQLAGRWATSKLLASLAVIRDPISNGYLCGDNPTYAGLKSRICGAADISSDPKADGTSAACDSLSVGFGFTANPARFAEVYEATPSPLGCADAGTPFVDQCPPP